MPRSRSVSLALASVQYLLIGAVVYVLAGFFGHNQIASLVLGAMAVVLLGGRLGLRWDDSDRAPSALALTLAQGFGAGAAMALVAVLVAALVGHATLRGPSWSAMGLALGFIVPLAEAARDELLFRGLPLAIMRDRVRDRYALPFTALLGGAPVVLLPGSTVPGVVLVVVSGLLFALMWRVGRGMYAAWGLHAGWLFLTGAGARGLLFDAQFVDGDLAPPPHAEGVGAWIAIAVFTVACVAVVRHWFPTKAR